jgi:hypothetical protein
MLVKDGIQIMPAVPVKHFVFVSQRKVFRDLRAIGLFHHKVSKVGLNHKDGLMDASNELLILAALHPHCNE